MRWLALALALLCLGALLRVAGADVDDLGDSALLRLDDDGFAAAIERSSSPALVGFVVPDAACHACALLTRHLDKVASQLDGMANVGVVDCAKAPRTCRTHGAHSQFPKLLVFKPGSSVNPYTGESMKDFDEFKEPAASPSKLSAALTGLLDDSRVTTGLASGAEVDAWLGAEPRLAKVLLFSDKAPTVLLKGLSWAYAGRLGFGLVPSGGPAGAGLMAAYGVEAAPALLLVKADGSRERYSGLLKAPALRAFLDAHAAPEPVASDQARQGAGKGPEADPLGLGALQGGLVNLTAANLTALLDTDEMWLLAAYAGKGDESCSEAREALERLLREVQDVVKFGWLDASQLPGEQVQLLGLDAAALDSGGCAPQLVLLPFGDEKESRASEFSRWQGGLGDAKALQAWILEQVPDLTAQVTSEAEVDAFAAATAKDLPGSSDWPPEDRQGPVAKVMLFSTKDEVPGIYKALAARFAAERSRLLFGWTSTGAGGGVGQKLMAQMQVRKAPAMVVLLPVPKPPGGADAAGADPRVPKEGGMAIQPYPGPLKFGRMLPWLSMMAALTGMAAKPPEAENTAPAVGDGGELALDIADNAALEAGCYRKAGLCLLALLDGRSPDELAKATDVLKQAAAALADQPVSWAALDASRQPSFVRALGSEPGQLPALLALSPRRMRFAQAQGAFSLESAKALVAKVLSGSAVTLPLTELPRLVEGGELDEEAGGGEAEAEEEFDLASIMQEDIDAGLLSKDERLAQAEEELRREQEAAAAAKKAAAAAAKKESKQKKKKKSKGKAKAAKKDEL